MIKLISLWFQIRGLEIYLDDQIQTLATVANLNVRNDINISRANTALELTRLKAEFRRIKHRNERQLWRLA